MAFHHRAKATVLMRSVTSLYGVIENPHNRGRSLNGERILWICCLEICVGLYGVMAYSVTQRTKEIGIRMALGAQRHNVLKLVLSQGIIQTLIGIVVGAGGAFWLTRLMQSMLFGVSATDPATFIAIALLLSVVTLLATYIPARRATKVSPLVALRYE